MVGRYTHEHRFSGRGANSNSCAPCGQVILDSRRKVTGNEKLEGGFALAVRQRFQDHYQRGLKVCALRGTLPTRSASARRRHRCQ